MSDVTLETKTIELTGMTCGHCVATVEQALLGVAGVRSATAVLESQSAVVSFDPQIADLSALRQALQATGYLPPAARARVAIAQVQQDSAADPPPPVTPPPDLLQRLQSLRLDIEGMTCASCVRSIEQAVLQAPGVAACEVSLTEAGAYVTFDPELVSLQDLLGKIRVAGYGATVARDEGDRAFGKQASTRLGHRLVVAAAFTVPLLVLAMSHGTLGDDLAWVQLMLALPVVVYGGKPFYTAAWNAAKHGRSDMNTLISVGVATAFAFSVVTTIAPARVGHSGTTPVYFETAATILTLVLLGRMLEARARHRTSTAIRKLLALQPDTVRVVRNGKETEIPVGGLAVGEAVAIRAGERLPIDGTVVEGSGAIDESPLTGESVPVDKSQGSRVLSGSLAKEGYLVVRAESIGNRTSLARMVQFVRRAQNSKSPAACLADRIAAVFVPAILGLAMLTFGAWLLLAPAEDRVRMAVNNAISVLIIACPCAVGLATPAALAVGIGKAAENGILVRDGEALEAARDLDTVVFDKTGTLTLGNLEVTDIETFGGMEKEVLLQAACAIERRSEHPIAQAIAALRPNANTGVSNFRTYPGAGTGASSQGEEWLLGKPELLVHGGISVAAAEPRLKRFLEEGKTSVLVARGQRLVGALALRDTLRQNAASATATLRKSGLKTMMMSGDSAEAARATATLAGIEHVLAPVLPIDKAAAIERLQSAGENVAMVGDGINDAPALAQADLGIALGAGSDITLATAGIILVRDDPADVGRAIELAGRTQRTIVQNYVWAFGYNLLGVAIATGVLYPWTGLLLSPVLASAAMALSSLSVLGNSLRLGQALASVR